MDAFVDSQVLLRSWNRRGSRFHSLVAALKCLFETTISLNIDLHVNFVPGPYNPTDAPSRRLNLQDSKWSLVQSLYGGSLGLGTIVQRKTRLGWQSFSLGFRWQMRCGGVNVFTVPRYLRSKGFRESLSFPSNLSYSSSL